MEGSGSYTISNLIHTKLFATLNYSGSIGGNEPPTLDTNTGAEINEGTTTPITTANLSASDPDDEPSALTFAVSDGPTQGELQVGGTAASSFTQQDLIDGTVSYVHTAGTADDDTFTFALTDAEGAGPTGQTFTITVSSTNNPPTASADEASTDEDTAVTVDVLANDTDPDGTVQPGSVTVESAPSSGTASANNDGSITYTPDADFSGTDVFAYTVADDDGAVSGAATVSVTVQDVNDAPVAADDSATTDVDAAVVIEILANDTDPDGSLQPSTVTVQSAPVDGRVNIRSNTGEVLYTPNDGFVGADQFTYTVDDDDGASSSAATVSITVQDTSRPPTANEDEAATTADSSVVIDVLANDEDADGTLEASTLRIQSAPQNGTARIRGEDGDVLYTPDATFQGRDRFTYTVADNDGLTSNAATVTVQVLPSNSAPVALAALSGDTLSVDGPPLHLTSLSASLFRDPDGDSLALAATSSNPAVLSAQVEASTDAVTLVPQAPGRATVTISASDGTQETSAAPFPIHVERTSNEDTPDERAVAVVDTTGSEAKEVDFGATGLAATFQRIHRGGTIDVQFFGGARDSAKTAAGTARKNDAEAFANVSTFRWQMDAPSVTFDSVNVRFRLDTEKAVAVGEPEAITVLHDATGDGHFEAVPTRFDNRGTPTDSTDDILVAQSLSELGTFRFASNSPSNPLPVELTTFTAALDGGAALLQWRTATETNNAGFEVQHRAPGAAAFAAAGFLEGAGTTTAPQAYRFRVEDLAAGTHRFRLRQVDADGTSTLTDPVAVTVEAERRLALRPAGPNPVRDRTQFQFTVAQSGPASVALYNVLGQRVQRLYDGKAAPGRPYTVDVSAAPLPSGTYFVRLRTEAGTRTHRMVVVR
jgi:hypothetical protein